MADKKDVAVDYINYWLRFHGFKKTFIRSVVGAFNFVRDNHIRDGCVTISAMLYLCARYCGYEPRFCYGKCRIGDVSMYHAWLEVNGIVIDIGIYGNVHYHPVFAVFPYWQFETPLIGKSESFRFVTYQLLRFDADWSECPLCAIEVTSFEEYFDHSTALDMWAQACEWLGLIDNSLSRRSLRKCVVGHRMSEIKR